jgi:hypothetical protein
MSAFFIIPEDANGSAQFVANTTVLCGGYVRAPHGAGLHRKVVVFLDNDPDNILGKTESTEPTGIFSIAVSGLPTTSYTVIAIGNTGEQSVIYSQCREF